jgi:hypothetical protein
MEGKNKRVNEDDFGKQESQGCKEMFQGRSFGEHMKAAFAYAVLATIFMAGFGVGAAIWSSSISPLQNDLSRIREERDRKEAELNLVKTEYAAYRSNQDMKPAQTSTTKPIGTQVAKLSEAVTPAKTANNSETVVIGSSSSADVFGGAITISVISIPFGGSPLRHTVMASVGAPGYQITKIENKDVGFSTELKALKRYEIKILAVDTFKVTFRVTVFN